MVQSTYDKDVLVLRGPARDVREGGGVRPVLGKVSYNINKLGGKWSMAGEDGLHFEDIFDGWFARPG